MRVLDIADFISTRGRVAERVQAFQSVQAVEEQASRLPRAASALSNAPETGSRVSYGHRQESSFGSPASRTSRDGADGVRGDGRPPVGSFTHMSRPSLEAKLDYTHVAPLTTRATTSLATRSPHRQDPLAALSQHRVLHRPRSVENMASRVPDLANARSRLKTIAEASSVTDRCASDKPLTMTELGDMIDFVQSSLKKTAEDDETELSWAQTSGLATPKTSMIRRWRSARAARRSQDASAETQLHSPLLQHDGVANNRWHPEEHQSETRNVIVGPAQLDSLKQRSPVRARAAMFEHMQQMSESTPAHEPPPDRHVHTKKTWKPIPRHEHTPNVEKDLHSLKFGRTIYDRPESSLGPHQSVSQAGDHPDSRNTSGDTSSFNTARQSVAKAQPKKQQGDTKPRVTIESPSRKESASWLRRWSLFTKEETSDPENLEDSTTADATNATKDEHQPVSRPSIVQSRIQNLLSAGQGSGSGGLPTPNDSHAEHFKRRPTPYPGQVKVSELKEPVPTSSNLKPTQLPAFQLPIQEEAEAIEALKRDLTHDADPFTSLPESMQEKEVLPEARPFLRRGTGSRPDSVRSASPEKTSPVKSAPGTPRRGRSLRTSLPPGTTGYNMEQAFVISPKRDRSRSRGSRMLVEVEIRDSPKEDGEKIVFVRADVDDIDEEEEHNA